MSLKRLRPPPATSNTRLAAAACLAQLAAEDTEHACFDASPYRALQAIAHGWTQHDGMQDHVWVVQAAPDSGVDEGLDADRHAGRASAWPLWFRDGPAAFETPLLYLLRADSVAELRALIYEAADRGILCNDAEITRSRWPKSVQPAVPLWLASDLTGTPYDPASGLEALAILRAALQSLYIEDVPGFFYLSLHDDDASLPVLAPAAVTDAYKGMYCLFPAPAARPAAIRLLGAGQALGNVVQAAKLLQADWQVSSEVWSCPSYTRLAREGHAAADWNMLHPDAEPRTSHLQACLGTAASPVLAVTGYVPQIAAQIGGLVPGRFVALGADLQSGVRGGPSAAGIVVAALKALGDAGVLPQRLAAAALRRYALA